MLAWGQVVQADIIDFDSLAPATVFGLGSSFAVDGFVFTVGQDNNAVTVASGTGQCSPPCPDNGTTYLINQDSGNFTALTLTQMSGEIFSLASFDAAESFVGVNFEAAEIEVIGTFGDGSTTLSIFTLDGIQDGPGGLSDFETFFLPSSFTNLISVSFNGQGGFFDGPLFFRSDFSIDNINTSLPVPEPSTLLLLGTGSRQRSH